MVDDNSDLKKSNGKADEDLFLLEQDRLNCIGCGACVAVAPDFWDMTDDGLASLIGGSERQDGFFEKNISKDSLNENKEAAESCPVTVIHIKDNEGKRLI